MITATNTRDERTGDGVTLSFTYTFRIDHASHIDVTVGDAIKTLDLDYEVSGVGEDGGGNVVFVAAPANQTAIIFQRNTPATQTFDLVNGGPLSANTLEHSLDKLTMIAQEIRENPGPAGPQGPPGPAGAGGVLFNVQDYGSIQAAINAAQDAGGGTVYCPAGTYEISEPITITENNVILCGDGPATVIKPMGSATWPAVQIGASAPVESPVDLASDGVLRAATVTLTSGGGASFAVGDYVRIGQIDPVQFQQTIIINIAGDVLTFCDPLYAPYATSAMAFVQKMNVTKGSGALSLKVDGSGNSGADSRGISATALVDGVFHDLTFFGTDGAALYSLYGYNNKISNIQMRACGSGNESDLEIRDTSSQIVNVISTLASGFGPQFSFCNNLQVTGVSSTNASGRGVKLARTYDSSFINCASIKASMTGISVTVNSSRNRFVNCSAILNDLAGLWVQGDYNAAPYGDSPGCENNQFINCLSLDNGSRDVELNAGGDYNLFIGLQTSITRVLDLATGTQFRNVLGGGAAHSDFLAVNNGATAGPDAVIDRETSSAAADDFLGNLIYMGRNSANERVQYARVTGNIVNHINGAEDGRLDLVVMDGGAEVATAQLQSPDNNEETALWLLRKRGGNLELRQVTEGANDSGGSGFRLLRTSNT